MLLCRLHPAREVQQRMHTQLQQLGSTTEQNAALFQHCAAYDPQGAATRLEAQAAARAHTSLDAGSVRSARLLRRCSMP